MLHCPQFWIFNPHFSILLPQITFIQPQFSIVNSSFSMLTQKYRIFDSNCPQNSVILTKCPQARLALLAAFSRSEWEQIMMKNSSFLLYPYYRQSNWAKIAWASLNVTPLPFDIFQILVWDLNVSVKVEENLNEDKKFLGHKVFLKF